MQAPFVGPRGPLRRLARIGTLPTDSPDEALRKETLVLSASLITTLAIVWVVSYGILGLYLSAAIPFVYQVVSIINLTVFAKTKRYRFFRACGLGLSLVLPFLLQLSLGGFVSSSGVVLWSFTAPLGALLFSGRREAFKWFVAFLVLMALVGVLDPLLPDKSALIPRWVIVLFFVNNVLGVTGTCYFLLQYFVRERDRASAMIAAERERSERLLLNVLPERIAMRLKSGESVIADGIPEAGVLFADIAGFTPMSSAMSPGDIVRLLDNVFTAFDHLAVEYELEKIKTIGDAYMVASGLLTPHPRHAEHLGLMALAMQREAKGLGTQLRIGIDVGPVVAGVIGRSKFIYDLWGDTVNTASRMESHGIPGSIQVTERAYSNLASAFEFEDRGVIEVKGKGSMRTYLLVGTKIEALARGTGLGSDIDSVPHGMTSRAIDHGAASSAFQRLQDGSSSPDRETSPDGT
jgi:adenylate cyclase